MSEERLIRSASRGNVDAFEQLIGGLAPTLFTYLHGMLGDEESAADAFEEVAVRLARSVDRYESKTGVSVWALQVARRIAADAAPEVHASGPWEPESGADWARRALLSLSVADRELVVCRELLEWDLDAIAALCGMEPEEVSRRLTDAREALIRGVADAGSRS